MMIISVAYLQYITVLQNSLHTIQGKTPSIRY